MNVREVTLLARKVAAAYEGLSLMSHLSVDERTERYWEYDILVDELVEATEGNESAFLTDPMMFDDFADIFNKSAKGLTYNQMAEQIGSATFGD